MAPLRAKHTPLATGRDITASAAIGNACVGRSSEACATGPFASGRSWFQCVYRSYEPEAPHEWIRRPLSDMQLILHELGHLQRLQALPIGMELSGKLVDAILGESSRFASTLLSPLNSPGGRQGPRWDKGPAHTASQWQQA